MPLDLATWAAKWGVPPQALAELAACPEPPAPAHPAGSEAAVQVQVRLEATRKGCRLWRNNVGAYQDDRGAYVRYGLANDSKAMNAILKSSDLVGIRPVRITQAHEGQIIGQFIAREIKAAGWRFNPNDRREAAQLKFLQLVASLGGDAAFANAEGTI